VITRAEILRRRRTLGVPEAQVERDYVLCHVLAQIPEELPELVFRGGTALARVYWPDYRLSEDLDFISGDPASDLGERLGSAVAKAASRTGHDLSFDFGRPRDGWSQSFVNWGNYALKIDVNMNERAHVPIEDRPLRLPYSDLASLGRTIRVVALEEILGNKWFMLDDRKEPRDLFDIWWGLNRESIPFERLAEGFKARNRFPPYRAAINAARRLEPMWQTRLTHQVGQLPSFATVIGDVRGAYEAWDEARLE